MAEIGDIDLDFADRTKILQHIRHITAARTSDTGLVKHNTGVYVSPIPHDPVTGLASIDYREAENRGYFKLDLLNVHVYAQVKDSDHLTELMREPDWTLLTRQDIVEQLIHLHNQWQNLRLMPQAIDSIPRLAMFLAIIRPGKRHLIGRPWLEVAATVWDRTDQGFVFKKSHAIAYSHLVVVHMNLLSGHLADQSNAPPF